MLVVCKKWNTLFFVQGFFIVRLEISIFKTFAVAVVLCFSYKQIHTEVLKLEYFVF